MMNIDWPQGAGPGMNLDILATIEVHCRRCGSHMGHVLLVEGEILHCINGTSLVFTPQTG
jgi:peptide-methionine (R)-S-oxide reductase